MITLSYILLAVGFVMVGCSIIAEDNVSATFSFTGVGLMLIAIVLKAVGG